MKTIEKSRVLMSGSRPLRQVLKIMKRLRFKQIMQSLCQEELPGTGASMKYSLRTKMCLSSSSKSKMKFIRTSIIEISKDSKKKEATLSAFTHQRAKIKIINKNHMTPIQCLSHSTKLHILKASVRVWESHTHF